MQSQPCPRTLLPAAALLVAGAAMALLYSVDASNGHNALDLPAQDVVTIARLAPQSWGFFTRNPQGSQSYALQRVDGQWQQPWPTSVAEPANLFGFSRTPRARGVELGLLVSALKAHDWHRCEEEPATCAGDLQIATLLTNDSPEPQLCGQLAFVQQPPVPWAWSNAKRPVVMPSFVARLEVQC